MTAATFLFDHAVIVVDDLDVAIANYRALGFTVLRGGAHENFRSHNALIVFKDGSYLELFAMQRRRDILRLRVLRRAGLLNPTLRGRSSVLARFMRHVAVGEGLADYALLLDPIDSEMPRIRQRGLHLDGPYPGERLRPDGRKIAWTFAIPSNHDVPFLLKDQTPRPLRVPDDAESITHANGATGLEEVVVVVRDLTASVRDYTALLGMGPQGDQSFAPGIRTAEFQIGLVRLTLAQPTVTEGPLPEHLAYRGEGPYLLRLRTTDSAAAKRLDSARTHRAMLELTDM